MSRFSLRQLASLAMAALLAGPVPPASAQTSHAYSDESETAYRTALDAYLYFYPLIASDLARRQATHADPREPAMGGATNKFFADAARYLTAEAQAVGAGAGAGAGMLHTTAWVDLRDGPVVLRTPDTRGRYYALTVLDAWNDAIAVLGKHTTGTQAGETVLVPPGWAGTLPTGTRQIASPTRFLRLRNAIRAFGPGDAQATSQAQAGFTLVPWSGRDGGSQAVQLRANTPVDLTRSPAEQIDRMDADVFFRQAADAWRDAPSHVTDQPVVTRLATLGLRAGVRPEFNKLDPRLQHALRRAVIDGRALMQQVPAPSAPTATGWQWMPTSLGAWGNDYLGRAQAARALRDSGPAEEEINAQLSADANGDPLDPARRYVLHFPADGLPPTRIGWALTSQDASPAAAHGAPSSRSISELDPLRYNPDGSLDIYIGQRDPDPDNAANWLALASERPFLSLTVYAAQLAPRAVLAAPTDWTPPAAIPLPIE